MTDVRVKACFMCKVYTPVDILNKPYSKETMFSNIHRRHPTQIVNLSDLNGEYTLWQPHQRGVKK